MVKLVRRGLERQVKIRAGGDGAGTIWFDTTTKFVFANEVTLTKSRKKKRSRTESTQEIPDENCSREKEKFETQGSNPETRIREARRKNVVQNQLMMLTKCCT